MAGQQSGLHVLHVTEALLGGVASYLNELIPGQRELGYRKITLIAPAEQRHNLTEDAQSCVTYRPYHRSGRDTGSLLRLRKEILSYFSEHQPDILHAHSSFAGTVARLPVFMSFKTPIVYCAHGWAFDMDTAKTAQAIYSAIERWLAPRSAAVVAISEHDLHSAVQNGLPRQNLQLVTYGLSSSRLLNGPKPLRTGPLRLLFVGRFDRQKGLDWLLKLFGELPQDRFELHLVGSAVLGSEVTISTRANLFVHGWQPQSQLDKLFDSADAVIMPSRWEGFGLVAIEAMRRATAVLASTRGALPSVLGETDGYLFPLDDPDVLKGFLLQIDRESLDRLGERGRQRFIERYRSERMIAQTDAVYRQVIDVQY